MEKRTPIQKSIVRHGLKMIDKKWAGRKVKGPAHEKALEKSRKVPSRYEGKDGEDTRHKFQKAEAHKDRFN